MVNRHEVLALIPARGGSKSIPRKNIRSLGEHPLIAWSIAAAQQARLVDRVIVSTDDEEIAAIARLYGAETPFLRPREISRDETPDLPFVQHALGWLQEQEGYRPDLVVQLRPTSPIRPKGLVDTAIDLLVFDGEADSLRSVTPPSQNPYKMWSVAGGALAPLVPSSQHEPYNAPRQSLPETFWQTGHIDAFWTRTVHEKASLTGDRILPVFVDAHYAIDIDSEIHLKLAEWTLREGALDAVEPQSVSENLLRGIRLFVFDFDGVFTDNRVYVDRSGGESVSCSRADGLGVQRLLSRGFDAAVLSSETDPVVTARCQKLRLAVRQGLADKGQALRELATSKGLSLDQVAYVGNDLNDLECLKSVRVAIVPADANTSVRAVANVVLRNRGGYGAVREVCDLAIAANGRKED